MGSQVDLDKCFELITKLVDEAGELIARRHASRKKFVCKANEIDLVTETDKEVEDLLINSIREKFPTHKFIGEEESSVAGAANILTNDPTWIIDPVDGTMNFVHGFPNTCVSVGLVVNKVTELGIVYNPILQQRFTARRGQGAFFNGKRIQVSGQTELCKALVASEFAITRDPVYLQVTNENFAKLSGKVHAIRCIGSGALNLCMVALGAADANYEFGPHAWDVCAAGLIVHEAGGVMIDPAGGKFDMMSRRVLAAATPELAQELAGHLTQYYPKPRDDEPK